MIVKIEKSITIDAPIEQVYAYMIEPANLPEYMVTLFQVKDVKRLPNGDYNFKYTQQGIGMPFEGTGECVGHVTNERATLKLHGPFVEGAFPTKFERVEGKKTRVTSVGEYTIKSDELARLGEAVLTRYLDLLSEASFYSLKIRFEVGIPVPTR